MKKALTILALSATLACAETPYEWTLRVEAEDARYKQSKQIKTQQQQIDDLQDQLSEMALRLNELEAFKLWLLKRDGIL